MKSMTRIFLTAQIADIAITFGAIRLLSAKEINPMGFTVKTIIFKVLVILLIWYLLEKIKFPNFAWIIPGIAVLVCAWNAFAIGYKVGFW